jgi:hypothetical protein
MNRAKRIAIEPPVGSTLTPQHMCPGHKGQVYFCPACRRSRFVCVLYLTRVGGGGRLYGARDRDLYRSRRSRVEAVIFCLTLASRYLACPLLGPGVEREIVGPNIFAGARHLKRRTEECVDLVNGVILCPRCQEIERVRLVHVETRANATIFILFKAQELCSSMVRCPSLRIRVVFGMAHPVLLRREESLGIEAATQGPGHDGLVVVIVRMVHIIRHALLYATVPIRHQRRGHGMIADEHCKGATGTLQHLGDFQGHCICIGEIEEAVFGLEGEDVVSLEFAGCLLVVHPVVESGFLLPDG